MNTSFEKRKPFLPFGKKGSISLNILPQNQMLIYLDVNYERHEL